MVLSFQLSILARRIPYEINRYISIFHCKLSDKAQNRKLKFKLSEGSDVIDGPIAHPRFSYMCHPIRSSTVSNEPGGPWYPTTQTSHGLHTCPAGFWVGKKLRMPAKQDPPFRSIQSQIHQKLETTLWKYELVFSSEVKLFRYRLQK